MKPQVFWSLEKNNRCAQIQFFKKIGKLNKQAPQAKNFLDLSILEAIFPYTSFYWDGLVMPSLPLSYATVLSIFQKIAVRPGVKLHKLH